MCEYLPITSRPRVVIRSRVLLLGWSPGQGRQQLCNFLVNRVEACSVSGFGSGCRQCHDIHPDFGSRVSSGRAVGRGGGGESPRCDELPLRRVPYDSRWPCRPFLMASLLLRRAGAGCTASALFQRCFSRRWESTSAAGWGGRAQRPAVDAVVARRTGYEWGVHTP